HHVEAHPGEPAARAAAPEAGSGAPGSGREDAFKLVGLGHLELVVATVLRRLVRAPAKESGSVAKTIALQIVVLHFADTLREQRLPREILARAPAALAARHAIRFRGGAGPIAPRM